MQTILAIDDEISVRESYRMILGDKYRVVLATDGNAGLQLLDEKQVDLILLDLWMPSMTGMQFLEELAKRGESLPVIVVTAWNAVEAAVQAMKAGARDFVIKPFDVEDLLKLVTRTLAEVREHRELNVLREGGVAGFDHIVGKSAALMDALAKARQAMAVDSTVLITGETGTGKDVLARAIHHGGKRKSGPYVPLCCSAIPATLVESELFGHVKGAFTGATDNRVGKLQVSDGGTLFLDEIGEMPMDAQAKLLRVLQDGRFYAVGSTREVEVDIRFVCATNRDFAKSIEAGQFRQDLYYRINVLPIHMPALRNRREDIPALVAHFVAKHAPRVNSCASDFSPRAMARMLAYSWPGNVRELENTVERILVCNAQQKVMQPEHLEGMLPQEGPREIQGTLDEFEGLPLQEATDRLERHMILRALEDCEYVQSQAADRLGTTRRILKYKMDQLGIQAPGEQEVPA